MIEKIYSFEYCDCIHEIAFVTISSHRTLLGAYIAMRKDLLDSYNTWRDDGLIVGKHMFKFGLYERWRVSTVHLLE